MAIFTIAAAAVVLLINLVVQNTAVAGDVTIRPAGVQCLLSEAEKLCDNYSILESPILKPAPPPYALDAVCPKALKAADCVHTLTAGCTGHSKLVFFESQREMLNLLCGSGRRDYLRGEKCYAVKELKNGLDECIATSLSQLQDSNPCSIPNAAADCATLEMKKFVACTTSDIEVFVKLLKITIKPTVDPFCKRFKRDKADASSSTKPPLDTQTKALTTSSSKRWTCQDLPQCQDHMMDFKNRGDVVTYCQIVSEALQCIHESLADCRRTGLLPEDQINQIESAINTGKLKQICPDLGPTMTTHEGSTAATGQSSDETDGRNTKVPDWANASKHTVEEKSFSLIQGLNASSLVNPFLAWLNSGSKLNKAQEKLAVEQKFVAKLMRKKLKLDISLLKKNLNGKKE